MKQTNLQPRVPARSVMGSLAALWACYFLLATLRGMMVGYAFGWPIVSRRLTICVLSAMLMAAVWPLLQLLERRPPIVRLAIVLLGALPLALGLAIINDAIFSDLETTMQQTGQSQTSITEDGKVRITSDDSGNILVDLPQVPTPPPEPPAPPAAPEAASPPRGPDAPSAPPTGSAITIHTAADAVMTRKDWLVSLADTTFGRYFLILAWAALYFALAKAEEARAAERREGEYRRAAAASELRSLRYQVNPHFLFNTLNSLSALVMTGRHDDAETMIQSLSSFYRHTLSGDPTGDLRLIDEIELQKLYLRIEGVRFPNRLRTSITIDDDVKDAMVPGMILQPLVENSVKYAVAATQQPVTIGIFARRELDTLEVTVCDDGPGDNGMNAGSGFGIGLANVRDRLRARFGDAARLTHGPRPEGGFATVLLLPLLRGQSSSFDSAISGQHQR